MKKYLIILPVLLLAAAAGYIFILTPSDSKGIEKEYTLVSPVYHVDKIYRSMMGPSRTTILISPV